MHRDARYLENDSIVQGDICIIGAGAAGISMALEWARSSYQVILLEGGGFQYEQKMQQLYTGVQTGQKYFPLQSIRLHYFGGTTGHWAGFCSVLDDIDFAKRAWVPYSGWPFKRPDLDEFYARAQEYIELGPYHYDAAYWLSQDSSLRPLPLDSNVIWNKIWQFSPPTRFGDKYRYAIVRSNNIHLYTYANACELTANENLSQIKEVVVKNFAGKQHRIKAKVYVLACGAVQNARLLLASNRQAVKGLGNQYDVVGRYFMEHIEMKCAELWLAKPDPLKFYMWEWGTKMRAELAITAQKQEQYRILNGTASLLPMDISKNMPAWIELYDENGKGGISTLSNVEKKRDYSNRDLAYVLSTRIEQAPNPESRVSLDSSTDELGMPRVHLNWALTDLEKKSMRKIFETIGQQIGQASLGRVRLLEYLRNPDDFSWPPTTSGGWHHMGTTRMGEDPKLSVTNSQCQVHGIKNLFVAGSSNFVTAGAPNPTLTLIALSLRVSDYIKTHFSGIS